MNHAYRRKSYQFKDEEVISGKKAEILPMIETTKEETSKVVEVTPAEPDKPKKNFISNAVAGRKSEVYPFQIEDLKKVLEYFKEHKMWIHRLILILSCNMARRIGDTLDLKWNSLYDPATGDFRSHIVIKEQKTDKHAAVKINAACKEAIAEYVEQTHCDPSADNYARPVFLQTYGSYEGKVITQDGYRKALKRAAKAVGIKYNVGTHSPRKTFGMLSRMIHPNDYESMQLLQYIYNHSEEKTTTRYIGLTQEKADKYHDDMGSFMNTYILGDNEYEVISESPVVNITTVDLRDIIKSAYDAGIKNSGAEDIDVHLDSINAIYEVIDTLKL